MRLDKASAARLRRAERGGFGGVRAAASRTPEGDTGLAAFREKRPAEYSGKQ
jgi:hypothetical protein